MSKRTYKFEHETTSNDTNTVYMVNDDDDEVICTGVERPKRMTNEERRERIKEARSRNADETELMAERVSQLIAEKEKLIKADAEFEAKKKESEDKAAKQVTEVEDEDEVESTDISMPVKEDAEIANSWLQGKLKRAAPSPSKQQPGRKKRVAGIREPPPAAAGAASGGQQAPEQTREEVVQEPPAQHAQATPTRATTPKRTSTRQAQRRLPEQQEHHPSLHDLAEAVEILRAQENANNAMPAQAIGFDAVPSQEEIVFNVPEITGDAEPDAAPKPNAVPEPDVPPKPDAVQISEPDAVQVPEPDAVLDPNAVPEPNVAPEPDAVPKRNESDDLHKGNEYDEIPDPNAAHDPNQPYSGEEGHDSDTDGGLGDYIGPWSVPGARAEGELDIAELWKTSLNTQDKDASESIDESDQTGIILTSPALPAMDTLAPEQTGASAASVVPETPDASQVVDMNAVSKNKWLDGPATGKLMLELIAEQPLAVVDATNPDVPVPIPAMPVYKWPVADGSRNVGRNWSENTSLTSSWAGTSAVTGQFVYSLWELFAFEFHAAVNVKDEPQVWTGPEPPPDQVVAAAKKHLEATLRTDTTLIPALQAVYYHPFSLSEIIASTSVTHEEHPAVLVGLTAVTNVRLNGILKSWGVRIWKQNKTTRELECPKSKLTRVQSDPDKKITNRDLVVDFLAMYNEEQKAWCYTPLTFLKE